MKWISDFGQLFYPNICAACGNNLLTGEQALCISCQVALPRTRYWARKNNDLEKLLWGRVDLQLADAFLLMPKKGMVQHLIHELKYKGNQELGVQLGRLFGKEMSRHHRLHDVDVLLPVPLHPHKKRIRGYNQCELIAEGMNEWLKTSLETETLIRTHHNSTQTRLSRFKRWSNVNEIFTLSEPDAVYGKHVLLIDDVITTGSTIEACAAAIRKSENVRLSVASLAIPSR
jgi:ComF family protein